MWLCLRFDGLCLCVCVCVCGSVCVVVGLNRLIGVSWVYEREKKKTVGKPKKTKVSIRKK